MRCGAKPTLSEGSWGVEAGEKRSQEVGGVSPVQGGSGRLTYVERNCCDHLMCEETVPTVPPTLTAPPVAGCKSRGRKAPSGQGPAPSYRPFPAYALLDPLNHSQPLWGTGFNAALLEGHQP